MAKKTLTPSAYLVHTQAPSWLFNRHYIRCSTAAQDLYRDYDLHYSNQKHRVIKQCLSHLAALRKRMKEDFYQLTDKREYEKKQNRTVLAELKPVIFTQLDKDWMKTLIRYNFLLYDLGKALSEEKITYQEHNHYLYAYRKEIKDVAFIYPAIAAEYDAGRVARAVKDPDMASGSFLSGLTG